MNNQKRNNVAWFLLLVVWREACALASVCRTINYQVTEMNCGKWHTTTYKVTNTFVKLCNDIIIIRLLATY